MYANVLVDVLISNEKRKDTIACTLKKERTN